MIQPSRFTPAVLSLEEAGKAMAAFEKTYPRTVSAIQNLNDGLRLVRVGDVLGEGVYVCRGVVGRVKGRVFHSGRMPLYVRPADPDGPLAYKHDGSPMGWFEKPYPPIGTLQRIVGPKIGVTWGIGRRRFFARRDTIRYCEHRGPEYLQRDGKWATVCSKRCFFGSRTELRTALREAMRRTHRKYLVTVWDDSHTIKGQGY